MFPLITADLNTAQQVMDPWCTGLTVLFVSFSSLASSAWDRPRCWTPRWCVDSPSGLCAGWHSLDVLEVQSCQKKKKEKKTRWNCRFPLEQRNEWIESKGSDCSWAYFWVLWPHSHFLQKSVILHLFIFYLLWDKDGRSSVNVAKMKTTMHWCQYTTV